MELCALNVRFLFKIVEIATTYVLSGWFEAHTCMKSFVSSWIYLGYRQLFVVSLFIQNICFVCVLVHLEHISVFSYGPKHAEI